MRIRPVEVEKNLTLLSLLDSSDTVLFSPASVGGTVRDERGYSVKNNSIRCNGLQEKALMNQFDGGNPGNETVVDLSNEACVRVYAHRTILTLSD